MNTPSHFLIKQNLVKTFVIGVVLMSVFTSKSWSLDRALKALKVDSLQKELNQRIQNENITAPGYTRPNQTGQAKHWLYKIPHTGKGVVVANHETVTPHIVFKEIGINGDTVARIIPPSIFFRYGENGILSKPMFDLEQQHGDMTAASIGGNGWLMGSGSFIDDARAGNPIVYWGNKSLSMRGVAPGVVFKFENALFNGFPYADVDNYSANIDMKARLENDAILSNHSEKKIVTVSAANEGVEHQHTDLRGYFSLNLSGKNSIMVGSSRSDLPLAKASHSSIGPTFDGRIGIDVMAPGRDLILPIGADTTNCRDTLMYVEIAKNQFIWKSYLKCDPILGHSAIDHGTSFSAPLVAGVVALMLEEYRDRYMNIGDSLKNRNGFWNSTVRGLLIHTATDMTGNSSDWDIGNFVGGGIELNPDFAFNGFQSRPILTNGPDWASGWGLVNAKKVVDFVTDKKFVESKITENQIHSYTFTVPDQALNQNSRVSITWDDPYSDYQGDYVPMLKNDLDLRVVGPNGQVYNSWVLDGRCLYYNGVKRNEGPDGLSAGLTPTVVNQCAATKDPKGDHINNVEVVDFTPTVAGKYTIEVKGRRIQVNQSQGGNYEQDYSLVFDNDLDSKTPISNIFVTPNFTPTEADLLNFKNASDWDAGGLPLRVATYTYSDEDYWYNSKNYTTQATKSALVIPHNGNQTYIDVTHRGEINLPMNLGNLNPSEVSFVTVNLNLRFDKYENYTTQKYVGNAQVFINAPSANIFSQYLGQAEIWCGGQKQCDEFTTYSFVVPLDIQKKLAYATGKATIRITLSALPYKATGYDILLNSLNFGFSKIADYSTSSPICNFWNGQGTTPNPNQYFIQQLATLPNRNNLSFTNYLFKCKAGATAPWCQMNSYKPIYEGRNVQPNIAEIQYWPSAWELIGICK